MYTKILRCSFDQIQEVSKHRGWVAAARCKEQRSLWYSCALEATIRHAIHVYSLQRSRNEGNAESGSNEAECRCDARGFLADAKGEASRTACRDHRLILPQPTRAPIANESFV